MSTERTRVAASPLFIDRLLQSEGFRKAQPFIMAAFLMLCFVNFPSRPVTTGSESWSHVLWQAREQGLRFGHDVVYTYGPAGFLFIVYYPAHTPAIRLISDVVCAYAVGLGVCLVAWQMKVWWRVFFLVVFTVSPATWYGLGMPELLFVFGLFCWGLLTRTYRWAVWMLIPLAALLALAKVSFLVTGTLTVLAVAWNRRSIIPVLAYGAAVIAFWLLLGQRLWDLWSFARNSLDVARGYDAAMVYEPSSLLLSIAVIAVGLLGTVVWKSNLPLASKLWMAGMVYCVWKASFVLAEFLHQPVFFGFAAMSALVLAVTQTVQDRALVSRILAGGCVLVCGGALLIVEPGWTQQDEMLMGRISGSLHLLAIPSDYRQATSEAVAQEKQKAELPLVQQTVGKGSVDVFGWNLGYAPLNDLNFTPRPCCQSYAAYTPRLRLLNAEFYRTNAPKFVLFRMTAEVDNHFPPVEDAVVLRDLAFDYAPVLSEGEFVLLKHATNYVFRLESLSSGHWAANEAHSIPDSDDPLWCEIKATRHPIRRFFYSEPAVRVGVKHGDTESTYNAPRPLLDAGFLARPLLLGTEDITNNLQHAKCELRFSEPVEYRFYRIARQKSSART